MQSRCDPIKVVHRQKKIQNRKILLIFPIFLLKNENLEMTDHNVFFIRAIKSAEPSLS